MFLHPFLVCLVALVFVAVVFWGHRKRSKLEPGSALKQAAEQLEEGVLVIGVDGDPQLMSGPARRLLGWRDGDGLPNPLRRLLESPAGSLTLKPVVLPGANDQVVEASVLPARSGRRIIILRDIAGTVALDAKRRDFVANTSHELRTPIAAISGLLDLLEDAEGDYAADLLARAQRRAGALGQMVEDLLGLARAESPDWVLRPEAIDVPVLFEGLKERFAPLAAKNPKVSLGFESTVDGLEADPSALETVLANLIDNALTHTEEGSVRVSTSLAEDGTLSFWVKDTGSGISPEIAPRIYERFFRGDCCSFSQHSLSQGDKSENRGASTGTGLGLSIVNHLVSRMGGRIGFNSTEGEGTSFQVELPPLGGGAP